jgi:predicted GNAT family acetyltransferase
VVSSTVRDNQAESRYEVYDDERLAGFAVYQLDGQQIALTHTEVAPAFGGRGLARQLVTEALDDARRRASAFCHFARTCARSSARTPGPISTWSRRPTGIGSASPQRLGDSTAPRRA